MYVRRGKKVPVSWATVFPQVRLSLAILSDDRGWEPCKLQILWDDAFLAFAVC